MIQEEEELDANQSHWHVECAIRGLNQGYDRSIKEIQEPECSNDGYIYSGLESECKVLQANDWLDFQSSNGINNISSTLSKMDLAKTWQIDNKGFTLTVGEENVEKIWDINQIN